MKISTQIRAARNQAGLTQTELDERIGCPKNTTSNYENELRTPSLKRLQKLAGALDCSFVIGSLQEPAKDAIMPRFLFGEWVLVDREKSGQIIECYGNSCIVDENGMWTEYQKERLTKDTRYLTPQE